MPFDPPLLEPEPDSHPAADAHGLDLVLEADPFAVRDTLRMARRHFAPVMTAEAGGMLEIVLAEVLNNITEHAYQGAGGSIALRMELAGAQLCCRVIDDGGGMPGGTLPSPPPICSDCPPAALPEGGFGWLLIRDLAQDLSYAREAGRNHLRFRLPLR